MSLSQAFEKHRKLLGTRWTFQVRDGWENVGEFDVEIWKMDDRGNSSTHCIGSRTYGDPGELWARLIDEAVAFDSANSQTLLKLSQTAGS